MAPRVDESRGCAVALALAAEEVVELGVEGRALEDWFWVEEDLAVVLDAVDGTRVPDWLALVGVFVVGGACCFGVLGLACLGDGETLLSHHFDLARLPTPTPTPLPPLLGKHRDPLTRPGTPFHGGLTVPVGDLRVADRLIHRDEPLRFDDMLLSKILLLVLLGH